MTRLKKHDSSMFAAKIVLCQSKAVVKPKIAATLVILALNKTKKKKKRKIGHFVRDGFQATQVDEIMSKNSPCLCSGC